MEVEREYQRLGTDRRVLAEAKVFVISETRAQEAARRRISGEKRLSRNQGKISLTFRHCCTVIPESSCPSVLFERRVTGESMLTKRTIHRYERSSLGRLLRLKYPAGGRHWNRESILDDEITVQRWPERVARSVPKLSVRLETRPRS